MGKRSWGLTQGITRLHSPSSEEWLQGRSHGVVVVVVVVGCPETFLVARLQLKCVNNWDFLLSILEVN